MTIQRCAGWPGPSTWRSRSRSCSSGADTAPSSRRATSSRLATTTTRSPSTGWRTCASGSWRSPGAGARITVHGDYDVDGVSSTTILVSVLRELGAEADWLIPDRLADGYGLTIAGVEEMKSRGTEMVITADCGIGSAAEVAAAKEAGIEAIVTDHHEPPATERPARLPDRPSRRLGIPVQRALRRGGRPQALDRPARGRRHAVHRDGRGHARRRRRRARPGRARHRRRPGPADRREPQAGPPGPRRDAGVAAPGPAGPDGRARRSSPRRWTSRPSASGSRRGSTPPAGSTARTPASS